MKRAALLVGINQYRDSGIGPLTCAVADARALQGVLANDCGFSADCLCDHQATEDAIVDAVERLTHGLSVGDTLLIYLALHGHHLPGKGHVLVPFDARMADIDRGIYRKLVALADLERLSSVRGVTRFLVVDACRTPLDARARDSSVQLEEHTARDLKAVTQQCSKDSPLNVLSACQVGQRAYELPKLGRSALSLALEQVLRERVLDGLPVTWPGAALTDIESRASRLLDEHGLAHRQNLQYEGTLTPFLLWEGRKTAEPPPPPVESSPLHVKCPRCRKWNRKEDTFECHLCQADFLCLPHREPGDLICSTCAASRQARWPKMDQPWENSLGLKFVPVPRTKVLFCIWETRVKDFERFAEATGFQAGPIHAWAGKGWTTDSTKSWKLPGFEQGKDHPVCGVSWEEAKEFCTWLTRLEQQQGKLGPRHRYRLPTDLEWSAAVGLWAETGTTPQDRDENIGVVYPWGTSWPPPEGAGTFSDAAANAVDPGGSIIEGCDGGWAETLPVGSFSPNGLGLYDLAGNVWEWCEDYYNGEEGSRVLRGGCWNLNAPRNLLSSFRINVSPGDRYRIFGFRLVVERDEAALG